MNARTQTALEILHALAPGHYTWLGQGATSVVFHDHSRVYRVFFTEELSLQTPKAYLLRHILESDLFAGSRFFYALERIERVGNNQVLIYPYEPSEPCLHFEEEEILEFLVECRQYKIIFKDVKPKNFIRVDGALKFIDYDPDAYTDNLFLNMVARAFIYCRYSGAETIYLQKLCRSAVNQFELPELDGLQDFLNRLFARIIFHECKSVLPERKGLPGYHWLSTPGELAFPPGGPEQLKYAAPYDKSWNPEKLFFQALAHGYYLGETGFDHVQLDAGNHFAPERLYFTFDRLRRLPHKASLVIKACAQDSAILYEAVKHIVRQTASPDVFDEKILALDIRRGDFLRAYTREGSWDELLAQAQKLMDEGIIHRFIYPREKDILELNRKWFDLETAHAHTRPKVPVAAQLFAFEQAANDYILQVDCDAMIGRRDHAHSFLGDMMAVLEREESVVSVGFNIYQGDTDEFKPYFGFEAGGFVPEVRFCLLDRRRIWKLLPLENEVAEDGLKLSWYRSLEKKQKGSGACSVRGGSAKSFFIHPQNFKKTDKDVWFTMLDRVEQLEIPEAQAGQFDLAGSYYDWTGPKRNEELVIVSCLRNISLARFLRFWYALLAQHYKDWGLILIDDASDNGISWFIRDIIRPFRHKITFVQGRFVLGTAHNLYKAVHYFMENQESVVAILDAGDALIGNDALQLLMEKYRYWKGDAAVGKEFSTRRLPSGIARFDFVRPRSEVSRMWGNLLSFRKYLFDSLRFEDFKILNQEENWAEGILLSKRFTRRLVFPQAVKLHGYAIPIMEMSENPKFTDYINYYHDEDGNVDEELSVQELQEILAKPPKMPENAFKGRKTFLPNLKKIEIDITYECNLKCINCNRSSTQAPIKEGMTVDQIRLFIQESIELGKKWELINILGGEPTIHKDFLAIVEEILNHYVVPFSPETILQITSNGYGKLVQQRLSQLPRHPQLIVDYASFKDDRVVSYFSPFNDAPIDNPGIDHSEYHKGCWVASYCGIGLNQLGYYPCGVAGGIDRVFELKVGVPSLKEVDESIAALLDTFCRYCGNFFAYAVNRGDFIPRNEKPALERPVVSETWKNQYRKYNGK